MTITEVTTTVVSVLGSSLGFERPLGNITRKHRSLDYVLATVTAEDGAAGLGYAFTPGYGTQAIRAIIEDDLRRLVVGQDPADHQALWQRMWRGTRLRLSQVARGPAGREVYSDKWAGRARHSADSADAAKPSLAKSAAAYLGPQGAALFAISAVDVACWDLEAKRQGAPLWRLFGGSGDPIPTYVTFGFVSLTIRELQQLAERFAGEGFRRMKLMVGQPDVEADVGRVKAVRAVVGEEVEIVLDVNQAWPDVATALPRARRLAELGIGWLEEPVPAGDVKGLAELRRQLDVPIAAGENAYTWLQAREFLEGGAVDIFQPDIYRMGGLTEHLRVCRRAVEAGVRLSPHHVPELNVHVLSALAGDTFLEYLPFFQDPFLVERSRTAQGVTTPSEEPGHGVCFQDQGSDE